MSVKKMKRKREEWGGRKRGGGEFKVCASTDCRGRSWGWRKREKREGGIGERRRRTWGRGEHGGSGEGEEKKGGIRKRKKKEKKGEEEDQ